MKNRGALPAPIVAAIEKMSSKYHKKGADYSVTELLSPPLMARLKRCHAAEIAEAADVLDRLYAIQGQAIHAVVEAAELPNSLSEERLTLEIAGRTVSGCADIYYDGVIYDVKTCSTWATADGVRADWEAQLNLYAHLYRHIGFPVDRLAIVAMYRDWSRSKSRRQSGYPAEQAEVLAVRLWSPEEAQLYMEDRVRLHDAARNGSAESVDRCTPAERWSKPTVWAVYAAGKTAKAARLHETEEAATTHAESIGGRVVHRPGEDIRCADYCEVSSWCPYWRAKEALA